jgi:polar amino acid transport system substrate-binding protein
MKCLNTKFLATLTYVTALTVLAAILGYGQSTLAANSQNTLEKVRHRGTLIAGVRYDAPPWGYTDKNGDLAGMGVELAKQFAKDLGVKVKFVQTTAASRIPLITGGHIDAAFGISTPTVERDQVVDFSIPYNWTKAVLLIRKDSDIKSVKDLQPSNTVSATRGSVFIGEFNKLTSNSVPIKKFQEYPEAITALKRHKVDAVLINYGPAKHYVKKVSGITIGPTFTRDPWAMMVPENQSDWRDWVNFELQKLWAKGTFQKLYKNAFGEKPDFKLWSPYELQPGIDQWQPKE